MEKASQLVTKPSGGRGRGKVMSHPTRTSPRKVGITQQTLAETAQGNYTSNTYVKQLFTFLMKTYYKYKGYENGRVLVVKTQSLKVLNTL